jgi:uncharacterized protein
LSNSIIKKAAAHVKSIQYNADESGHDWLHTERVWLNTQFLANKIDCDIEIAELGAIFHDIADAKFHEGDETIGANLTRKWLEDQSCDTDKIDKIIFIIDHVSFRKGYIPDSKKYPELAIVQDADRLDAIGAIGIARAFSYGGYKQRPLYNSDPDKSGTTIGHFHEKLFKLKELMNTKPGKKLAEERHNFMLDFHEQFNKDILPITEI